MRLGACIHCCTLLSVYSDPLGMVIWGKKPPSQAKRYAIFVESQSAGIMAKLMAPTFPKKHAHPVPVNCGSSCHHLSDKRSPRRFNPSTIKGVKPIALLLS
ncbi:hypothetical protein B0J17DRAFT_641054 [Rhizoctonia solani]|nr:hypothetical protein B0J17DRAFT_641054 [Rhizoctonia solani]